MSIINVNNNDVYYEVSGQGKQDVILMHGWGQTTKGMDIIIKGMDLEKFRVFNIDFPGHGNSPIPEFAWSVYDYNDMLEDFIKKLDIKNPILVGHSFGGRIATIYGAKNQNLKSMVFVDAAGVKPKRTLYVKLRIATFKLCKKVVNVFYKKRKTEYLEMLNLIFGSGDFNATDPKLRNIFIKTVNEDLTYLYKDIKVPVRLLWGEDDDFTPVGDAKIMNKKILDSELSVYKNAGHYSYMDKYAEFIEDFNEFITRGLDD